MIPGLMSDHMASLCYAASVQCWRETAHALAHARRPFCHYPVVVVADTYVDNTVAEDLARSVADDSTLYRSTYSPTEVV